MKIGHASSKSSDQFIRRYSSAVVKGEERERGLAFNSGLLRIEYGTDVPIAPVADSRSALAFKAASYHSSEEAIVLY